MLFTESDFLALMAADEALSDAGASPHFISDAGDIEGRHGAAREARPRDEAALAAILDEAHALKSAAAKAVQ